MSQRLPAAVNLAHSGTYVNEIIISGTTYPHSNGLYTLTMGEIAEDWRAGCLWVGCHWWLVHQCYADGKRHWRASRQWHPGLGIGLPVRCEKGFSHQQEAALERSDRADIRRQNAKYLRMRPLSPLLTSLLADGAHFPHEPVDHLWEGQVCGVDDDGRPALQQRLPLLTVHAVAMPKIIQHGFR